MTGADLIVRPIADGEEAAVIALWHACGLTRPWNDPMRDLTFARGKSNSEVLVGSERGRILASAVVGHDGHRGTMYYVSVDPASRNRGYGRRLVAEAEIWLKERGIWKVNLLVRKGNEPTLGFYQALGYADGSSVQIEKWIDLSKRPDKATGKAQESAQHPQPREMRKAQPDRSRSVRPNWPRCGASAAIFRGDDILLVERGKGTLRGQWSLPGGHIEPGERAGAAALRETREETGVRAELCGLVDIHEVVLRGADDALVAHYLLSVFYGRWLAGEPAPGGDAASARFVHVRDLDRYTLTEGAVRLAQRAWSLLKEQGT